MLEEVAKFKYLKMVMCNHGSMQREIRERVVKGRQEIGMLERDMKGSGVRVEVKKGI